MILLLIRFESSDQGTKGILILPDGKTYCTLELPWKNNRPMVSCIPEGTYRLVNHYFRGYRRSFRLLGVPGRSFILIHNGNFAGDEEKGFKTHSRGCILVGRKFGTLHGQLAVLYSIPALSELTRRLWGVGEKFIRITTVGGERYVV